MNGGKNFGARSKSVGLSNPSSHSFLGLALISHGCNIFHDYKSNRRSCCSRIYKFSDVRLNDAGQVAFIDENPTVSRRDVFLWNGAVAINQNPGRKDRNPNNPIHKSILADWVGDPEDFIRSRGGQ